MFFRPNKALLLAGKKLKSTYNSLELTTAIRLLHSHTFAITYIYQK